jgi:drug/metabolite transporter (DMT)-like permease
VVEAGIYQVTTPLFAVVIAWAWLGERLSRGRLLGVAVATLGALVLVTGGGAAGLGGGDLPGALFILGSNLTWAGYTILIKELLARRSPLLVVAATNLIAAVAILPLAALFGTLGELPSLASWSPSAWMILVYLVAFMSTSSQWLYLRCLREIPASQASAFMNLMPFFTALEAAVFLGELPTPLTIGAGLLILLGVWLVNRPRRAAPRPRSARAAFR